MVYTLVPNTNNIASPLLVPAASLWPVSMGTFRTQTEPKCFRQGTASSLALVALESWHFGGDLLWVDILPLWFAFVGFMCFVVYFGVPVSVALRRMNEQTV